MAKGKNKNITRGVVIVLVVLLIWGLVGSSAVAKVGNTCDMGIRSSSVNGEVNNSYALCWSWHRNLIGNIQDAINGGTP